MRFRPMPFRLLFLSVFAVLTVPAHPFLWNENDELSHHRRRYTREGLRRLLGVFEDVVLSYWNTTFFLPAFVYCLARTVAGPGALMNNLERIPLIANRPLRSVLALENRLRELVSLPTGVSLVALARRAGGASSRPEPRSSGLGGP